MRSSFRRMMFLSAVTALSVGATVSVASTAHAVTSPNTVRTSSDMKGCPRTTCVQTGDALAGDQVTDFCRSGSWDMIYSFQSGRAPGFVLRSTLRDTSQFTDCQSGGSFTQVAENFAIRIRANTVVRSTGPANTSHTLRYYCFLNGETFRGNNVWYLVYNNTGQVTGYIPEAIMTSSARLDRCDD